MARCGARTAGRPAVPAQAPGPPRPVSWRPAADRRRLLVASSASLASKPGRGLFERFCTSASVRGARGCAGGGSFGPCQYVIARPSVRRPRLRQATILLDVVPGVRWRPGSIRPRCRALAGNPALAATPVLPDPDARDCPDSRSREGLKISARFAAAVAQRASLSRQLLMIHVSERAVPDQRRPRHRAD